MKNLLFDEEFRLEKISVKQDPLEKLNKNINWEIFRPILNQVFEKEPKGKGGRPPI
ncbi:MAG: family transposase [Ignavibacteria bacterium]|nr:family transposase [Ignavibacteria bacterium]